ncbi:hypothetical protein JCM8097_003582 [Rhodosporidiobolus ruineniae]
MPPKAADPSSGGQQTLSSFFKPSSAAPKKRPPKPVEPGEVLVLSDSDDEGSGKDGEEDSRLAKRVKVEQDAQDELAAPSKTPTLTSSASTAPKTASAPSASSSRLRQFAYTAPTASSADPFAPPAEPKELTAAAHARREAFAKRLSLAGVGKRRSGYLEKEHYLAAREGDEAGGGRRGAALFRAESDEDEGGGSGGGRRGRKGQAGEESEEEDGGSEDGGASSPSSSSSFSTTGRFAKFAAKGKGKASPAAATTTKGKGKGKGGEKEKAVKYTPLEQQVLKLKKEHPGVLLVVEVGYKFRFFGEDAQHASRTLNIACFPSQHMLTASIPTHRLDIHVRRLLNAGYKVGVVRQLETAALKKAGDNRSAPFDRALTALYTSATFVDELGVDPLAGSSSSLSGGGSGGGGTASLMCIVEDKASKLAEKVRIGLVAVSPSTGEVIYDEFEDNLMRAELETRMLHLQPSELLLQKDLTSKTESIVKHLAGQHNVGVGDFTTRIERISKRSTASQATTVVSEFYAEAKKAERKKGKGLRKEPSEIVLGSDEEEEDADDGKEKEKETNGGGAASSPSPLDLPKLVLIALSALIAHLKAFSLDTVFLHTSSFSPFASRASMTLSGNTVANLELLRNSTDYKEAGSLVSVIDRCKSSFGKRLLRKWVTKPLLSVDGVNARLDAISEIHSASASLTLSKLRDLLRTLPDLERGLARIHFGRASPNELLRVLEAFRRVGDVFDEVDSPGEDEDEMDVDEQDGPVRRGAGGSLKSELLRRIVRELPRIKRPVKELLEQIEVKSARDNKKETLFTDEAKYPDLLACKAELADCEAAMTEELKAARRLLRKPALQYTKVSQEEYLLEVKVAEAKTIVPADWVRINATKQVHRYRSPKLQKKLEKLEQAREKVAAAANAAFLVFLSEVASHYESFRTATASLATADCLLSLAVVALSSNWVRPNIVDEPGRLEIVAGRHPIIEAVSSQPFVPNSVEFGGGKARQMVLTGLNMGGKSSLSRSIALIALLAQIGSFVPAEACTSSLFDGIYTRMGANDDMARGRSTFMAELSETSELLRLATPRSLIVLDELGRGTSTNDGQAIAEAVLEHIVREKKSLTVFVTHYPALGGLAKRFPESVSVNHMSCVETPRPDGEMADVFFLYKLASGLASASHGLNVARLAELPEGVIDVARRKADELRGLTEGRLREKRRGRLEGVLRRVKDAAEGRMEGEEEKSKLLEACEALVAK